MKNQRKFAKAMFAVAAIIAFAGTFAGTARADDDDWRHEHHGHGYGHEKQEWREHERQEWRERERWEWRRDDYGSWHHIRIVEYVPYYVQEPVVVYQPPVRMYYPPAPVYVAQPQPSGFNIVIPLTIK